MKMLQHLQKFAHKSEGAVTVDWVVISAMVVGLALAAFAGINDETVQQAADIGATIEAQDVTGIEGLVGSPGGD